jgi:hypothetical protein
MVSLLSSAKKTYHNAENAVNYVAFCSVTVEKARIFCGIYSSVAATWQDGKVA